ncbi:DUF2267 domain-containing protein [Streptomyces sp. NPDC054796]|uniref:DUF2267 domain-containing protein n=1 Tax=Streptomyces daliensis TaxID=299421 RepID=A0A8T4IN59_9ACTN|nr:DUF2267 domain-containing protein [Streptomyces daliensis]
MDMSLEALLEQIRERGNYRTLQEAAGATQAVLETLGAHLVDEDRARLATFLPQLCAPLLTPAPSAPPRPSSTAPGAMKGPPPGSEPLTFQVFLDKVGTRHGGSPETARRDADAVLSVIAERADDKLIRRILDWLPPGHAALFGLPEPG